MKKATLPEPRKAQGTLKEYYKTLRKLGYRKIGSGAFSTVWGRGNVAIKVAESDGGYDHFLSYALAHQDNPYFPKIYAVARYEDVPRGSYWDTTRWTVVTMERLKGDKKSSVSESIRQNVGSYRRKNFISDNPKEKEAMAVLAELEKKHGRLDMHSGNVMMRGEQPVIIDPVAG